MIPSQNQLTRIFPVPSYARLLNFDHQVYRIPTSFSSKDHCSLMEVTELGRRLIYIGPDSGDVDAATARSECEIPPQCGVFYFEVNIISKGRDGFLSVGLITKASLLKKLVGWETGTIGYHGDDGCVYMGSGKGHPFGPTYSEGDVIGCGVNFVRKRVFFTKNGSYIGDKTYPVCQSNDALYAAFGMKSAGECGMANFGSVGFAFDIDSYIHSQQIQYSEEMACKIDRSLLDPPVVPLLVLKHLVHMGCEQSVRKFYRAAFGVFEADPRVPFSEADLVKLLERSKMRRRFVDMVLKGEIQACLDALAIQYPALLLHNADLDFLLHSRLFVEAVIEANESDFSSIFKLGQVLEEKLQYVASNPEFQMISRDALALIAYKDVRDSPSAYLLSDHHSSLVASALEDALLREDEMSVYSPLEKLIRAYQTNIEVLRETGHKEVALIEPLSSAVRSQSIKPE